MVYTLMCFFQAGFDICYNDVFMLFPDITDWSGVYKWCLQEWRKPEDRHHVLHQRHAQIWTWTGKDKISIF